MLHLHLVPEGDFGDTIAGLGKALLILHSPLDAVVGIDHAARIFAAARHPESFITLDRADHLLTDAADSTYAGAAIATWAHRYLVPASGAAAIRVWPEDDSRRSSGGAATMGDSVWVAAGREKYATGIRVRDHGLTADEPVEAGGGDRGPTPYDLLLAALGSCTAMTLRMYADHKGWDLETVKVKLDHQKVHAEDCSECETQGGTVDQVEREIVQTGALDETQRARLLEIAARCPVHRPLHSEINVRTREGRGK